MLELKPLGVDVRPIRRWFFPHAVIMLVISAAAVDLSEPVTAAVLLFTIGAISFSVLPVFLLRGRLRLADLFSLSRPAIGLIVMGIVMQTQSLLSRCLVLFLLIAAALTDVVDGKIARSRCNRSVAVFGLSPGGKSRSCRNNTNGLFYGGIIDAESDSFFIFTLGYAAYLFLDIHPVVLIIGAMRYGFGLLFFLPTFVARGKETTLSRSFSLIAKTVCVMVMVAMIILYVPFLGELYKSIVLFIALTALSGSFLLETAVRVSMVWRYG